MAVVAIVGIPGAYLIVSGAKCSLNDAQLQFSTSPIDYYDGGTVRLNTEFYSWDTSFGLFTLVLGTHVCKLYSASTLVLF